MSGSWGGGEQEPQVVAFDLAAVERDLPSSWGASRVPAAAVAEHMQILDRQDKWDRRGVGLAREVASWSSCPRAKVGAVVLSAEHDVIATGFNDTAAGLANCGDGGCPRAFREDVVPGQAYLDEDECLHAEDNALQRAGLLARGATMYVTREPCGTCARRAKTAGIVRTVVMEVPSE